MAFKGKLISSGINAKTVKGDKLSNYETAIMYLAPADAIEGINLCPMARIAGCRAGCLNTAGRGAMNVVQRARGRKTMFYRDDREGFMRQLVDDIQRFVHYCYRKGVKPAVRLNGTSDIQWEVGHSVERGYLVFDNIFEAFPEVEFYDYTKICKRVYRDLPRNYSLVLSYSEANPKYAAEVCKAAVETQTNVAVVYRSKEERDNLVNCGTMLDGDGIHTLGACVIDGDETDLRFLDPKGVIVGLYAKGQAKRDTTGFVVG